MREHHAPDIEIPAVGSIHIHFMIVAVLNSKLPTYSVVFQRPTGLLVSVVIVVNGGRRRPTASQQ